ncbi:MAG: transglutaminase family protein [Proteobacteria bacterium]|nr:transglutaminase family protein [Pseudomonadota bacterium]
MQLKVHHQTQFEYEHPVSSSQQLLRLRPRNCPGQRVLSSRIEVKPASISHTDHNDSFGNQVDVLLIQANHHDLLIESICEVELDGRTPLMMDLSPPWETIAAEMRFPTSPQAWQASAFCFPSKRIRLDSAIEFAQSIFSPGRPLLSAAMELTSTIFKEFTYDASATDVNTPVAEIVRKRRGVCQDFAHLAISVLRSFGLPARYVSGYLHNDPKPSKIGLVGIDASHAWISVWCRDFGWVDFDPTNNLVPDRTHITIGWGRDYDDVRPTTGFIRGGGRQTLRVGVAVHEL